jgi:TPR repeat protein
MAEEFNIVAAINAAEQGDANTLYNLGLLYYEGKGIPKDEEKAREMIRKAAAQGNEKAKEFLVKEAKADFDLIQTLKGELREDPSSELARLLGNLNSFREDMPYAEMLKVKDSFPRIKELLEAEKQWQQWQQRQQWQKQGLCKYCGDELKGFFTKTCKQCGKVN